MKRKKRSTSDIISYLPSNVTENILKDLPLRDAVRTSVLSRKWRYKWVTLPELVINDKFFLEGWDDEKVKAVIYQVLLFHRGPLIKFTLRYPPFESCLDINNWIFVLSTKNIQDFTFYLQGGLCHEIPCHFYSFMKLRDLNVAKCVFKPPPTFKGFSRLVNLIFVDVTISSEMRGLFISSCPLLERLQLTDCAAFDSLEINAPNLKYFGFFGIFESVSLENTPCLAEISVTLVSWYTPLEQPEEETDSEWVKFFRSLPAIEDMHLDRSFLELQEVEIRHFSGADPEMLFVKILLAYSVVLKKMVIWHEHEMSDKKGFAMVKELTRFPRASSDAELIVDANVPTG
ncbi:hypothetical protein RHGRI_033744 [Rhododendron griersonianum]|uniref:F-box domain-containing protein n=1 Tax=Rhododendron griersonianum TaxID=479676 RepID=A0AAV6I0H9_9ERIC|nr:hypothetical protein RHGRI_033744 [Rhododendron griersonianum]